MVAAFKVLLTCKGPEKLAKAPTSTRVSEKPNRKTWRPWTRLPS